MSRIALNANASGSGVFTVESPNSDTDRTLNLPDKSGTVHVGEGIVDNANATAITIDSSENALFGTTQSNPTSSSVNVQGIELSANGGGVRSTVESNPAATFNRKTDDGSVAIFRKDGNTVGLIGTRSAQLSIGKAGTGIEFNDANDAIIPFSPDANNTRDNALDLGMSSVRFDDIFATNGTIQTSDANEKQDIEALLEAEQRVAVAAKALLRKFRWKSAVEEKGDDARIHFGIIAQDLQAAFEAEGLDAGEYGMFIHTTWTDEETGEERDRMGIRYSELLSFIIAAI